MLLEDLLIELKQEIHNNEPEISQLFKEKMTINDKIKLGELSNSDNDETRKLQFKIDKIDLHLKNLDQETNIIPKKFESLKQQEQKLIAAISETSQKISKVEKILNGHKLKLAPLKEEIEAKILTNQKKIQALTNGTSS